MRAEWERRRRVLSGYRGTGPATRAHLLVRTLTAPFRQLDDALPRSGRILDVGCGHGVLTNRLATSAPARLLTGVDIDLAKLEHARTAAGQLGVADRVAFRSIDQGWIPEPDAFDAVVCVDVLYLLGLEHALLLIDRMAAAVRAGGLLVVKEMGERPRWKRTWTEAQERISTRVLHITEGSTLEFVEPDDIAAEMLARGFATTTARVDRGHLHPHVMVTGRRPG